MPAVTDADTFSDIVPAESVMLHLTVVSKDTTVASSFASKASSGSSSLVVLGSTAGKVLLSNYSSSFEVSDDYPDFHELHKQHNCGVPSESEEDSSGDDDFEEPPPLSAQRRTTTCLENSSWNGRLNSRGPR